MPIKIRATGSLKKSIPPDTQIDDVRTVGEAVAALGLPEGIDVVTMVNGKLAQWHTPLQDGDVVQLVPVISGG